MLNSKFALSVLSFLGEKVRTGANVVLELKSNKSWLTKASKLQRVS